MNGFSELKTLINLNDNFDRIQSVGLSPLLSQGIFGH